jgi:hypothetical protein
MLRSVLSVLAGIVVLRVASFAIEAALDPLLLRLFPRPLPNPAALSTNQWARTFTFAYGRSRPFPTARLVKEKC